MPIFVKLSEHRLESSWQALGVPNAPYQAPGNCIMQVARNEKYIAKDRAWSISDILPCWLSYIQHHQNPTLLNITQGASSKMHLFMCLPCWTSKPISWKSHLFHSKSLFTVLVIRRVVVRGIHVAWKIRDCQPTSCLAVYKCLSKDFFLTSRRPSKHTALWSSSNSLFISRPSSHRSYCVCIFDPHHSLRKCSLQSERAEYHRKSLQHYCQAKRAETWYFGPFHKSSQLPYSSLSNMNRCLSQPVCTACRPNDAEYTKVGSTTLSRSVCEADTSPDQCQNKIYLSL